MLLFFWNLAYMYWLSAMQLDAWMTTMQQSGEENPETLHREFTRKVAGYRKLNVAVLILIYFVTFVYAWSDFAQNFFDYESYGSWFAYVLFTTC